MMFKCWPIEVLREQIGAVVHPMLPNRLPQTRFFQFAQEVISNINMPRSSTHAPIVGQILRPFIVHCQHHWFLDRQANRFHQLH